MNIRFKVESVTLTTFDETVTMVIVPVNDSDKLSEQILDNLGPGQVYELTLVEADETTEASGNSAPASSSIS